MIDLERPATLRGERVRLRPYAAGFREDELAVLYRWACDEEILALSGGRPVGVSYERFRELFLTQLPRRNSAHEQLYAILDEKDALIGRTGLFAIEPAVRTAELGIVIGERSAWGRGYGRDTVRVLADHALGPLGFARLVLHTYPDNERARRAFEAVGFRERRRLRRFTFERGSHEEIQMELRAGRAGGAARAEPPSA